MGTGSSTRMRMISFAAIAILFGACRGERITEDQGLSVAQERQRIEKTYRDWSTRLIAQDYEGALAYCVPGSNCAGATGVARGAWARGNQHYFDFTFVEGWLDEDDLARNYGEAVGNYKFIQIVPSEGLLEFRDGFYSDLRKIDGMWKIDGFNGGAGEDWWR